MNFTTADAVEQVVWSMKLTDLPRATNRTNINNLANGFPPYTTEEQEEGNIVTNVNFLPLTTVSHNARRQYYNAFLTQSRFFTVTIDKGPIYKRHEWGRTVTKELNRIMKESLVYLETKRSEFANVVLHGIGPKMWNDDERWCPDALSVGDVLLPSNTKLTMQNLQYFAVWRSYTPAELWQMTHGAKVDPGWKMDIVNECIKKADEQTQKQISYSETWSPELIAERYKQDLGYYASDDIPTIDCWDFYFWNPEDKISGWNRRMVLDWPNDTDTNLKPKSKGFLFDPGTRKYADKLGQIMHWQFGDASAVAPFRYHSVRSLGYLLYAVCHLQNRLLCKLNDAAFESLMWYFRVANPEDRDRLQKIDLHNFGIIPEGLDFIKQQDRYSPDYKIADGALGILKQHIQENSASYTQDFEQLSAKKEQTATEVMAKVNSTNALVSSMLDQAYNYAEFEYREICRRFCIPNSRDADVRRFRARCFDAGVPEEVLDVQCWNVEANRVIGAGNKMLQIAQADKLMAARNLYDPEPQREILYLYTAANTDDPKLADRLVPIDQKKVSEATHDAQQSAATLLMGLQMNLRQGVNHIDYAEALMGALAQEIGKVAQRGGMATSDEIGGMINLMGVDLNGQPVLPVPNNGIASHIALIAADPNEKQRVKQYSDDLGRLQNMVKEFIKNLQQAQQQGQQGGNGQMEPADQAKVQATIIQAQTKADLARQSHSQKTAQRQVQWQMEQDRKRQEHQMSMREREAEMQLDNAAKDVMTAAEIRRQGQKAITEQEIARQKGEQEAQPTKTE